jgi:small subunit ribosomal protein S1
MSEELKDQMNEEQQEQVTHDDAVTDQATKVTDNAETTTDPVTEPAEEVQIQEETVSEATTESEEQEADMEAESTPEATTEDIQESEPEATEEIIVEEVTASDTETKEESPEAVQEEVLSAPQRGKRELLEPGDFDWDAVDKKQDQYDEKERNQLASVYEDTLQSINEQQVIDGTVVAKNSREVVVNIGYKSDGVISLAELRYRESISLGDTIEVYVENQEDPNGQLVLSHKKARVLRSWERINQAMEQDEIINGFVKCRTKGGLIVDVFGIEAFLPGSQIDVKPIRDYDIFVGKTMEFKVVKINHEYKNVVVSHKALIQDELEKQKAEIISKLEKGQILEGTVKNITSYGVFIDLGGVDGLIHITDLSWGRINHPEEIVNLDEKIKVVILDFDDNKKRIALGLKQLTPHPWNSLSEDMNVGDKVKGKVVVIADYGAFVEIAPGVEGLVHVSEMSWSQHLRTAHDFLKVGDEIEAVILTLDREDRKMSLGIKQLIPDPWADIATKYPANSKHTAIVRNFTNFGIFVELEEGVDGLIHISDLSWQKKIKHPAEFTKTGETLDVIVLDVDVDNRRLSLGHKQLEENPWEVFETVFTVDSVHKGTVMSSMEKGAIITLPYGVEGFAPLRHLNKEDNSMAKVDETLDFKVIEFSKENKKIIVSHTKTFQDRMYQQKEADRAEEARQEQTTTKAVKKIKDNLERTTLGDLSVLADLKEEIMEGEVADAKAKLEAMEKKQQARQKTKAKAKDSPKTETEAIAEEQTEVSDKAAEVKTQETTEVTAEEPAEVKTEETAEVTVEEPAEVKAEETTEVTEEEPADVKAEETTEVTEEEPADVSSEEQDEKPKSTRGRKKKAEAIETTDEEADIKQSTPEADETAQEDEEEK